MPQQSGNLPLQPVTSAAARAAFAPVTCVYTDLDGTLFAPGGRLLAAHDGTPSCATASALVALQRAGVDVTVVTGRNRSQGVEIMRLLNLSTFIAEMGCLVLRMSSGHLSMHYHLGDWAHCELAPGLAPGELPDGATPISLIRQSGSLERLFTAFAGKLEMHNPYMVDREVTLTLRGEVSVAQANSLLANEPLPLQLVDNGVVHPREHTLQNVSEVHSYHLMPRGAGKAQAVAASMVSRGLQPEQTVAIGDSVGDMAMGAHTGSIVMVSSAAKSGVAQAALAARAQTGEPVPRAFCTTHPTSDGWAEFANALLAAKG